MKQSMKYPQEMFRLGVISSQGIKDNHTGRWRWLRPEVREEVCNGCGHCVLMCPDLCIRLEAKKARVNYTYCKGCGICAYECKHQAVTMRIE